MPRSRMLAMEIAAQVALALAIGLSVSIVLAGAAMLLAEGSALTGESPKASHSAPAGRA